MAIPELIKKVWMSSWSSQTSMGMLSMWLSPAQSNQQNELWRKQWAGAGFKPHAPSWWMGTLSTGRPVMGTGSLMVLSPQTTWAHLRTLNRIAWRHADPPPQTPCLQPWDVVGYPLLSLQVFEGIFRAGLSALCPVLHTIQRVCLTSSSSGCLARDFLKLQYLHGGKGHASRTSLCLIPKPSSTSPRLSWLNEPRQLQ